MFEFECAGGGHEFEVEDPYVEEPPRHLPRRA